MALDMRLQAPRRLHRLKLEGGRSGRSRQHLWSLCSTSGAAHWGCSLLCLWWSEPLVVCASGGCWLQAKEASNLPHVRALALNEMVARAHKWLLQATLAACPDARRDLQAAVIATCFNAFFQAPRGPRVAAQAPPLPSSTSSTSTTTTRSSSSSSASSSDASSTTSSSSSSSVSEGETGPDAHEPAAGSAAGAPSPSSSTLDSDTSLAHPEGTKGAAAGSRGPSLAPCKPWKGRAAHPQQLAEKVQGEKAQGEAVSRVVAGENETTAGGAAKADASNRGAAGATEEGASFDWGLWEQQLEAELGAAEALAVEGTGLPGAAGSSLAVPRHSIQRLVVLWVKAFVALRFQWALSDSDWKLLRGPALLRSLCLKVSAPVLLPHPAPRLCAVLSPSPGVQQDQQSGCPGPGHRSHSFPCILSLRLAHTGPTSSSIDSQVEPTRCVSLVDGGLCR